MSLMKTLARVAAGVALAKGIGTVMQNRNQGSANAGTPGQQRTGKGGLLDDLVGSNLPQGGQGQGGSLRDRLTQVLGGNRDARPGTGRPYGGPSSTGAQGGLGGILDQLTNRTRGSGSGGGLSDILGQLAGGRKSSTGSTGGGLGDLLGGLLGGAAAGTAAGTAAGSAAGQNAGTAPTGTPPVSGGLARKDSQASNDASFGELFNDAVARDGEPEIAPTPEQNAVAGLMLKAMIMAAKSDGKIDDEEKQRLLGHLGETLDDEERQFIRDQMAAPVDAAALAREVPKGLESQVYLMSLMAIDFDNEAEAKYLRELSQAMGLSRDDVAEVHEQLGAKPLEV